MNHAPPATGSLGALRPKDASWVRSLHADCSGATATEYLLILALVVLPIALLTPLMLNMLKVYGTRIVSLMGLPFP
jgi:Flp pilus assembly pilin Flp